MQNSAYDSLEQFSDEEKFTGNFNLLMDGNYGNYGLNYDHIRQIPMQIPSSFGQGLPEHNFLTSYSDIHKGIEDLQSRNRKMEIQNPWAMGNVELQHQYNNQSHQMYSTAEFDGNAKMKKIKTNQEVEMKVPFESIPKTKAQSKDSPTLEEKAKTKKGVKKQDSLKNAEFDQSEADEEDDSVLSMVGTRKPRSDADDVDLRQAKNREAARNSRLKKKAYVELLEKTVEKLQHELIETRKQLEAYKHHVGLEPKKMEHLCGKNRPMLERLEKLINAQANDTEIGLVLDSMRFRCDNHQKEIKEVVNSMFKQILESLFPIHTKYVLLTASQDKDAFAIIENLNPKVRDIQTPETTSTPSPSKFSELWNELGTVQLNMTETQRKQVLKYKKKLLVEKQKFEDIIQSLNQVRKALLQQVPAIESISDKFGEYLGANPTAKILVLLEKEKHQKEYTAEKLWSSLISRKESQDDDSDDSDNFLEHREEEDD